MEDIRLIQGDCLTAIDELPSSGFDLVYLDPPFFSQKCHVLSTRDGNRTFSFEDVWRSHEEYADFVLNRLLKLKRVLKPTGSLFFHCDRSGSHIARLLLDEVFGLDNFRSEIIWTYRRWSNSNRGLLPAHQNIYFYSNNASFKFNEIMTDYSAATNLEQIVQKRVRDGRNKSVYARDHLGDVVIGGPKRGVPLADVWDIPYLNPKAKERVGYPTQKPVLLLERIIELVTDPGDWVLDPFCGSGTTLVAARLLGRSAVGIDISADAISLAGERIEKPMRSESNIVQVGRSQYERKDQQVLGVLDGIDCHVVQRNKGIDAIMAQQVDGKPVFLRVQRAGEPALAAADALVVASQTIGPAELVVIVTGAKVSVADRGLFPSVRFFQSLNAALLEELGNSLTLKSISAARAPSVRSLNDTQALAGTLSLWGD